MLPYLNPIIFLSQCYPKPRVKRDAYLKGSLHVKIRIMFLCMIVAILSEKRFLTWSVVQSSSLLTEYSWVINVKVQIIEAINSEKKEYSKVTNSSELGRKGG